MNLLKKEFVIYHATSSLAKESHCEKIRNKYHSVDLYDYLSSFRKIRINPFSNLLIEFIRE